MIKQLIIGMIIGIANILPGISGGTIALSIGLYDKIIYALTHILSDFKNSLKTLAPILLGAVVSILCISFAIEYLFLHFPIQTNLLFVGLIVGGLPKILDQVKGSKLSLGNMIAFTLFFALIIGLACIGGSVEGKSVFLNIDILTAMKLFLIGILAAATMIIPGVSGTMILMILGFYQPIIRQINIVTKALATLDLNGILAGFGILAPFGMGVLFGMFAIAKGIEVVFSKFPQIAYFSILGLIMASPIGIMLVADLSKITIVSVFSGLITFAAGCYITQKLN